MEQRVPGSNGGTPRVERRGPGDRRHQGLAAPEGTSWGRHPVPEDHRALVQELRVHQIELEMHNEELGRAQQELEMSREDYFNLYDLAPVGYLTLSERSLILEANLTAATLLGLDRAKLLKLPFSQLVHPEDLPLFYRRRKQLFEQGTPQVFELRLVIRGSELLWVNAQAIVAQDRSGLRVWRITLGNITEHKNTESALFQSQKLESLGVLAGGVAHDFNNLLSAMQGNIELAALDQADGGLERHLEVLQNCVQRAAGLCRQMLAYAGKGQFLREAVGLNELVQGHLGFLSLSLAEGVAVRLELEPELPGIEGDPSQLVQVLMNLVINGSEAIGLEGGTLWIRTRRGTLGAADLPALVPGSPAAPGPFVVLEVEDTGVGMDPVTLRKIFDPFFTTKFIGRGLGLAALLGIMRMNRGAVQVRSQPGRGTCFSLWFPL